MMTNMMMIILTVAKMMLEKSRELTTRNKEAVRFKVLSFMLSVRIKSRTNKRMIYVIRDN